MPDDQGATETWAVMKRLYDGWKPVRCTEAGDLTLCWSQGGTHEPMTPDEAELMLVAIRYIDPTVCPSCGFDGRQANVYRKGELWSWCHDEWHNQAPRDGRPGVSDASQTPPSETPTEDEGGGWDPWDYDKGETRSPSEPPPLGRSS